MKENTLTIDQLIKTKIAKLGENIVVSRFVRFKVGDAPAKRAARVKPPVRAGSGLICAEIRAHPAQVERRGDGRRRHVRH